MRTRSFTPRPTAAHRWRCRRFSTPLFEMVAAGEFVPVLGADGEEVQFWPAGAASPAQVARRLTVEEIERRFGV